MKDWLFDITIIAGAFLCFRIMRMMTLMLAHPFVNPRLTLDRDYQPPEGLSQLYAEAHEQLSQLGFSGPTHHRIPADHPACLHFTHYTSYHHPVENILVTLYPTFYLDDPHQLMTLCTSISNGGTQIHTQVRDPMYTAFRHEKLHARVVAAGSYSEAVQVHRKHVAEFLTQSQETISPPPDNEQSFQQQIDTYVTQLYQDMLASGDLRKLGQYNYPSWKFALRLVLAYLFKQKRTAKAKKTCHVDQLSAFSKVFDCVQNTNIPVRVQLEMFFVSLVVSLAAGALVFGFQVTLILLGIIFFHEAGHWLAMRANAYRNVSVTFLPLLGGVTMGTEQQHRAAQRAWVALMGPLPGIVLAFLLWFGWESFSGLALADSSILLLSVALLLLINYLNLLPIPPLDGSLVIQSLLPQNAAWAQLAFMISGITLGCFVGYLIDRPLIIIIACSQLLLLPGLLRNASAWRKLNQLQVGSELTYPDRVHRILLQLEERFGAPDNPKQRVFTARNLAYRLALEPMPFRHGLLVSLVFVTLFLIPTPMAYSIYMERTQPKPFEHYRTEAELKINERTEQWVLESQELTMRQLLERLNDGEVIPPASDEQIAQVEQRLGRPLPDELKAFYQIQNGLPSWQISPLEMDTELQVCSDLAEWLKPEMENGRVRVLQADNDHATATETYIPIQELEHVWCQRGGADHDFYSELYFDPGALDQGLSGEGNTHGVYLYDGYSTPHSYRNLTDYLRKSWVEEQRYSYADELVTQARDQAMSELADATVPQLVRQLQTQPVNIFQRVFVHDRSQKNQTLERITALESRIGRTMDEEYKAFMSLRHRPTGLYFINPDLVQAFDISGEFPYVSKLLTDPYLCQLRSICMSPEELAQCWIIAGDIHRDEPDQISYPRVLWCPENEQKYLSVNAERQFKQFSDYLRYEVAARQIDWID